MRVRFIIGYLLSIIGLIIFLYTGLILLSAVGARPVGGGLAGALLYGLAVGIVIAFNILGSLIFLFPGAYLIRVHTSNIRRLFGLLTIILAVAIPLSIFIRFPSAFGIVPILMTFPLSAGVMMFSGKAKIGLFLLIILVLVDVFVVLGKF